MLTFEQAREKARESILKLAREVRDQEFVILDDRVSERVRGWVFPYNTKKFAETKNPRDGVGEWADLRRSWDRNYTYVALRRVFRLAG